VPARARADRGLAAWGRASGLDLRGVRDLSGLAELDLSDASFDDTSMRGPITGCDLSRASMVGFDAHRLDFIETRLCDVHLERANLSGARMQDADLSGANLAKAKLVRGSLSGVRLVGARITGADLRFAHLARANLAGADLTGAKLTDASLGGVAWDDRTILRGTDLTGASIDDDFIAFARAAGAVVRESEGAYELAVFDATAGILRERNRDGHLGAVIARLASLREQVVTDPNLDWAAPIAKEFSPDVFEEVEDALQEAGLAVDEYT